MRANLVTLNIRGITSEEQLFELLINEFEFPELYARSWDGMKEHLFYDSMMKVPENLIISGFKVFQKNNPKIAKGFDDWLSSSKTMSVQYREK